MRERKGGRERERERGREKPKARRFIHLIGGAVLRHVPSIYCLATPP